MKLIERRTAILSNYKTMDINILHSIVNMKLRNEKQTLNNFCSEYQIEQSALLQRFNKIDLIYDVEQNQFKQTEG